MKLRILSSAVLCALAAPGAFAALSPADAADVAAIQGTEREIILTGASAIQNNLLNGLTSICGSLVRMDNSGNIRAYLCRNAAAGGDKPFGAIEGARDQLDPQKAAAVHGAGQSRSGPWSEVTKVTTSDHGAHISLHHGQVARTHLFCASGGEDPQMQGLIADIAAHLDADRGYGRVTV